MVLLYYTNNCFGQYIAAAFRPGCICVFLHVGLH